MTSMINRRTNGNSGTSQMPAFLGHPIAFAGRVARRIRERRELNRVLSFPDYLLEDIGLRRDEMQRKALDSLWRE
ncbi:MAG: hypothetical protein Q8L53_06355 [Aestuariivirga sp.]|nr:hypothetical protein [Aestuariivirga sp.]